VFGTAYGSAEDDAGGANCGVPDADKPEMLGGLAPGLPGTAIRAATRRKWL